MSLFTASYSIENIRKQSANLPKTLKDAHNMIKSQQKTIIDLKRKNEQNEVFNNVVWFLNLISHIS